MLQKSYVYPKSSQIKKKKKEDFGQFRAFSWSFLLSHFSEILSQTHTNKSLFLISSKIKRQCSCFHLLLLGPSTLILRFKGCECSFLATIYTHFLCNSLLLSFKFLTYFIAFLACFIAFLACSIALILLAQSSWVRICLNLFFVHFFHFYVLKCLVWMQCLDALWL